MLFKIKISKAKASIDLEFDDLPDEMKVLVVQAGLEKIANAATAKLTKDAVPNEDERATNALKLAQTAVDKLKAGELKAGRAKGDGKVPGVVMTEARRLAKNIVKASIKAAGQRISDYEAKALTEAANLYLADHQELVAAAQASIEASKTLATQSAVDVSHIPVSETKRAANEKKKAEARAATEAKNAGKPGPQKSATKHQAPPVPPRKAPPAHTAMH